jgi:hypothetical protein
VGGKKPLFLLNSSGNFGNGLAYHTQDDPIDLVVVTDVLSPVEARDALRAYRHVRLEVIGQPDESGSHLKVRQELMARYLRDDPSATVIDRYGDRRVLLAYEASWPRSLLPEPCAAEGWVRRHRASRRLVTNLLPAPGGASVTILAARWQRPDFQGPPGKELV